MISTAIHTKTQNFISRHGISKFVGGLNKDCLNKIVITGLNNIHYDNTIFENVETMTSNQYSSLLLLSSKQCQVWLSKDLCKSILEYLNLIDRNSICPVCKYFNEMSFQMEWNDWIKINTLYQNNNKMSDEALCKLATKTKHLDIECIH